MRTSRRLAVGLGLTGIVALQSAQAALAGYSAKPKIEVDDVIEVVERADSYGASFEDRFREESGRLMASLAVEQGESLREAMMDTYRQFMTEL